MGQLAQYLKERLQVLDIELRQTKDRERLIAIQARRIEVQNNLRWLHVNVGGN